MAGRHLRARVGEAVRRSPVRTGGEVAVIFVDQKKDIDGTEIKGLLPLARALETLPSYRPSSGPPDVSAPPLNPGPSYVERRV